MSREAKPGRDELALAVVNTRKAEHYLALASTASQAKAVAVAAKAAEMMARKMKVGAMKEAAEQAEKHAHAIYIDALTLMGEFLKAAPKNKGGRPPKNPFPRETVSRNPTRAEQGAARKEGWQAEAIADVKAQAPATHARVRAGEVSVKQATSDLRLGKLRADNARLVAGAVPLAELQAGPFPTIVADPPWDWDDEGDKSQFGRGRPGYATLSFDELLELPVGEKAAENAHLYLWITNRSLPKGFALLEAWGFRYANCLTCGKPSPGMGNEFRGQTEHILFAKRGRPPFLGRAVGTLLLAKRGPKHSSKPGAFYELVESCSPGPWLELFSRQRRPGWVAWGAEAE
jgi:N6-adenosine-specific RNA methylase IME4